MVFYDGMIGGGKGGESYVRAVRGCGATIYDYDCDSILNEEDNCINDYNPGQANIDADGLGDVCDPCINDPDNDADSDSICGDIDNCPNTPNGALLGTCVIGGNGVVVGTGKACTSYEDCEWYEYCQMEQGNCNSNSCGDACECYADIVGTTGKVDLSDLVLLKQEFNKSCPPCAADFNGDEKVNLSDLTIMKIQFNVTDCPNCP
jgi:hypothetical protein